MHIFYICIISALNFPLFIIKGIKCVVPNCQSGLQSNKKEVEDLAGKDVPARQFRAEDIHFKISFV